MAAAAPPSGQGVAYDGKVGPLAGIVLVNGLRTLITLGGYRFWGKTRLRRYLWSHIAYRDDALEYTGRGRELFLGFMVVLAILMPLVAVSLAIDWIFPDLPELLIGRSTLQISVIYFLVYFAVYRARRYRLSRTRWRGIRAGQTGSATKYALLALLTSVLAGLTLGLAYPYYRMVLRRYELRNTWLGDQPFRFDGRASALFWRWLAALLLILPTLGLSYLWYRVAEFRYVVAMTRYGPLSFDSRLSTFKVLVIYLIYGITVTLTLLPAISLLFVLLPEDMILDMAEASDLLAWLDWELLPSLALLGLVVVLAIWLSMLRVIVFMHPFIRVVCTSLTIHGEADFSAIAQSRQAGPARGEGLADALDVGAI